MHWRPSRLRFEDFRPQPPSEFANEPFTVRWAPTGQQIDVPADRSMLAALQNAGIPIRSSCGAGTCQTCVVALHAGTPEHRDVVLTTDQRAKLITPCVSRAEGLIEVGPA
nr:2Fe-2S iron-sulfur cluster binding domain-containing protein [Kineosporia babensis]